MITQLRLELLKLFRSRSFYLSFAALLGFVLLMLWGFYSYAQRKTNGLAAEQFKYTYESKSYFNGLTFTLYSLVFAFSLLIPIFVAMTAGGQIAGERRAGTLRMICVRPVSRVSLVLSKFVIVEDLQSGRGLAPASSLKAIQPAGINTLPDRGYSITICPSIL